MKRSPTEYDLYMGEKIDFTKHGWTKERTPAQAKTLVVHYEHSRYDTYMGEQPKELIIRELAYKLAESILENDLVRFNKNFHTENFKETYSATVVVVDPGIKYMNLEKDVFKVDGEVFDNEELIKAVKEYYAERFI